MFRAIVITVFLVRRSEPSSVFRSTFRVTSSVSTFRVVITSQFDVQSHHHHFSVSAFRAIIGFQIDVQSRYHSSASVFRAIVITVFSDRRSESHPRFRCSESLSLFSLAFRVITVILFRLPEPLSSSCLGFQSHFYHLV